MHTTTQCKLFALLAMLATTITGCRSVRELWPLAKVTPTSLREPQASQPPNKNSFSFARHKTSPTDPRALLPSLDAVDSLAKPAAPASAALQEAYGQPTYRPAPQSLINAFDDELPSLAVEGLPADKQFVPLATHDPMTTTTPQATATQRPVAVPAIRLVIAGVRPGHGDVKVAIFTDGAAFPEPAGAVQTFSLPSSQPTLEQGLDLSSAFAVAVYQDVNGDGELSRSRLGIPVEPFAFSNNVMGQRGPPTFQQASVVVPGSATVPLTVTINLP